jgi:hypothetical protein
MQDVGWAGAQDGRAGLGKIQSRTSAAEAVEVIGTKVITPCLHNNIVQLNHCTRPLRS